MTDYQNLLDNAFEKIKTVKKKTERFEILETDSLIQGKKTLIKNLQAMAKNVNRDIQHISKYFAKETGAVSNIENGKLMLNSSIPHLKIKQIYKNYVNTFVLCKQCGKPDTKLVVEKGATLLKCEACGAMTSVKKI